MWPLQSARVTQIQLLVWFILLTHTWQGVWDQRTLKALWTQRFILCVRCEVSAQKSNADLNVKDGCFCAVLIVRIQYDLWSQHNHQKSFHNTEQQSIYLKILSLIPESSTFFLNWQRTAGKEHQNLGEVNYIQFLQQYILYINILNSSLQLLQKSPICFHQKKS